MFGALALIIIYDLIQLMLEDMDYLLGRKSTVSNTRGQVAVQYSVRIFLAFIFGLIAMYCAIKLYC